MVLKTKYKGFTVGVDEDRGRGKFSAWVLKHGSGVKELDHIEDADFDTLEDARDYAIASVDKYFLDSGTEYIESKEDAEFAKLVEALVASGL